MNMKKTIAGLVASVVAISAMATTMVSAKDPATFSLTGEQWEIVSTGTSTINDESVSIVGGTLETVNQIGTVLYLTTNNGVNEDESIKAKITYKTATKLLPAVITPAVPAVPGNDGPDNLPGTADDVAPIPGTPAFTTTGITEQGEKTVDATFVHVLNGAGRPIANQWKLTVKTDNEVVNTGEVYIPGYTMVTNISLTIVSKPWYKTNGTKSAAQVPLDAEILATASVTTGSQIGTLFNTIATGIEMPGKANPVPFYPVTLTRNDYDNAIMLSDIYGEARLSPTFVTFANNYFKGTTDGQIILEVEGYNYPTVTDPTLGGPQSPDRNGIELNLTAATAKHFGLALNYRTTEKLVSAADVVDGKLVFNYADLTAAMGTNFTGNINDMAIKVSSAYAGKYDEIRIKSFTYVAGAAVTDPTAPDASTPDASTPGTGTEGNPVTGNAPIALAIIPVALAAAAIVASKKRA